MSKNTTIVLPISKEEFLGSLEYVLQIARQAPVSADTHDKVRGNINFILQGIQNDAEVPTVNTDIEYISKGKPLISKNK